MQNLQGRPKRSSLGDSATLLQTLERLGIAHWDVVIVGDGSGTGWNTGCGWGAILVERLTRARRTFFGGMNAGSVNMAEIMPVFHALSWYHEQHGSDRLKRANGKLTVHVLSDSQVTTTNGNEMLQNGRMPKHHIAVWAGIRQFVVEGYDIKFRWLPRETIALHWLTDALAGNARIAVNSVEMEDGEGRSITPYEFNQ